MLSMYNLKETEKVCDLFISAYHSYNDYMLEWVESKPTLLKTVQEIFAKAALSNLPHEYWISQASLYTDAHMLMDPKAIRKMRRAVKGVASDDQIKALTSWVDNPGFWCFYTIKETLGNDFFLIEDLFTGDTHLMHAPNIASMQTNQVARNRHYLSLMLFNGLCLQVIGLSKYTSLTASDMQFYLSLFAPGLELGAAINKHFMRMIELDTINKLPLFTEGSMKLKRTWQPFKLESFAIEDLPGHWGLKDRKTQQKFTFIASDPSIRALPTYTTLEGTHTGLKAALVRERTSGEMGLMTSSDASYSFFAALLNSSFDELNLPEEPSVSISLSLTSLLDGGNYPVPWKKYRNILALGKGDANKGNALQILAEELALQNPSNLFDIRTLFTEQ